MEVESSKTKQALNESQARNQHLQEQVAMQRQVLKEMEQQLQSSHQLTAQLRAQVCGTCKGAPVYLGSMCVPHPVPQAGLWHSAAAQHLGSDTPKIQSLLSLLAVCPRAGFCFHIYKMI